MNYSQRGTPRSGLEVCRDLIHAAVMLTHGIDVIISADTYFDIIEGVRRLDPGEIIK